MGKPVLTYKHARQPGNLPVIQMVKRVPAALLGLAACMLSPVIMAQGVSHLPSAGSVLEQSSRTQEYLESQRRLKLDAEKREAEKKSPVVEDETQQPKQVVPPAGKGPLIPVSRIVVDRSEILREDEIRALVSPYEGREVSIEELYRLLDAINARYAEKKFSTARALLPPQKIRDGIVRIQLAEGKIGQVSIEGNATTNGEFIRNHLNVKEGRVADLEALEHDLLFFNGIHDISLRAELKPGKEFGTVDAILKATEPQRDQLALSLDNTGRESIGLIRLGVTYTNASMLGFRDALTASAYASDGMNTQSVAYSMPVGPYGTRLGIGYDRSKIEVKHGKFDGLDIGGGSHSSTANLKQPLFVTATSKVEGLLTTQEKRSNTTFSGVEIAETKVRTHSVGLNAQRFDTNSVWQTSHTITSGEETQRNKSFARYNADVSRLMRLDGDRMLTLRGNLQWADSHLLPSTEQYQLGGLATVRGYSEGLLSGDKGYFISAEMSFPMREGEGDAAAQLFGGQLRGTVFFDHGGAFPYKGNNKGSNKDDYLTSAGFGLLLNFSKVSGRVDIGFPLGGERHGEEGPRIHFTLQAKLF